jgi:hypothetical protein
MLLRLAQLFMNITTVQQPLVQQSLVQRSLGQKFELIPYQKFRDTPSVKFFDVTITGSNARDLVVHTGPATSPNNSETGTWQFYLHPHQEDNLLALSGGRTFYLVNFAWDYPFHMVRLESDGDILRIPPGTFHRSVSDLKGSIVLNQALRDETATIEREFRVYDSGQIPRLMQVTAQTAAPPMMHGFAAIELRRVA